MDWTVALGICGTVFGIVVSALTIVAKIRSNATEDGKVSTRLALIQQSMSNLEKGHAYTTGKVDTLEKAIADHSVAIASLNESTKSAHHRIDEIRDKMEEKVS